MLLKIVLAGIPSVCVSMFVGYNALEHNPQEEFCEYQAYASGPSLNKDRKNFILENSEYVQIPFDQVISARQVVYVEYPGRDIYLANARSGSDPCTLKIATFLPVPISWFAVVFTLLFILLNLINWTYRCVRKWI